MPKSREVDDQKGTKFPVFRLKAGEHHYGAAKYGTRCTATAGQIMEPTSEKELKFMRADPVKYEEMPEGTAPTFILPKRDKDGQLMQSAGEQEEELSEEELMVQKSEFDRPDSEKRNLPAGELTPARPLSHIPLQKSSSQIMTPGTASARKQAPNTDTMSANKKSSELTKEGTSEGDSTETTEVEISQEELEKMHVGDLKAFCKENEIDLKGANTKEDILKRIKSQTK